MTPRDEADLRLLSRVAQATATRQISDARREQGDRSASISGRAASYDTVTGDWLVHTDSGGSVRATLNSNGAPIGRLAIARPIDTQICEINAPPTTADNSPIVAGVDAVSARLVALMGARDPGIDPTGENPPAPRYPNELIRYEGKTYAHNGTEWIPVGGGGEVQIYTGPFDPNELGFEPPEGEQLKPGARYWDSGAERWLTFYPTEDPNILWKPDGTKIFTGPVQVAYPGDGYIQPNDEGACLYIRTEENGWQLVGSGCSPPSNAGPGGPAPASCPRSNPPPYSDLASGERNDIGVFNPNANWFEISYFKLVSVMVNAAPAGCREDRQPAQRIVGITLGLYFYNPPFNEENETWESWATGRGWGGYNYAEGANWPEDIQFGIWTYNGNGQWSFS